MMGEGTRLKSRALYLALLLAGVFIASAKPTGQSGEEGEAIILDGVTLKLGMPRGEVVRRLSQSHHLIKGEVEGREAWAVHPEGDPSGDMLGMVVFENGSLVSAQRSWVMHYDEASLEFGRALVGAMETVKGRSNCTVSISNMAEPKGELKWADLTCGHRNVEIGLFQGRYGRSVGAQVSEIIRSSPL
jgi:hypothetical protein